MLGRLALKNVRRSIKDYAIYFFTLVLGVTIFYIFNSISSQTIMLDVSERVRHILELMGIIMGTVSVLVSIILGALIIYASRFLMKRRSREFGVYLTLGMSKRKISLILIVETLVIGILSLGVGLIAGILISQLTSVLVANMFDANLTEFHFVFSGEALLQTIIYFSIIYLIVILFNTIIVSRQKLINLLSSSKFNEKIKLKSPLLCSIVFVIASIILGIAYYLVTRGINILVGIDPEVTSLLIPIIMGAVATFLLFWSLSGLLLRVFMSLKKIYYKKLNSFVLREFSSKINTTVISMSLICLMLFVTICVLGTSMSINSNLHATIEKSLPVDVEIQSMGTTPTKITEIYKREGIDLNALITDHVIYRTYRLEDLSLDDTLGPVQLSGLENERSSSEMVIYESEYNRAARLFGLSEVELGSDGYAILADFQPLIDYRNEALALGVPIKILDQTLLPRYDQCIYGTIELNISNMNAGLIIIPDQIKLPGDHISSQEHLLANFADDSKSDIVELELKKISNRFFRDQNEIDEDGSGKIYYYSVSTRQEIIDNNVGTSALVTFVGLYIGLIFLIASAAVLALKQLSDSSDNREKYAILRKIGASNSILNRALFWQIFIFFGFPLAIAALHSVFGLMFCDLIISTLGGIDIMGALPGVIAVLLLVYGGYFMITYFCSKNIIREHRN